MRVPVEKPGSPAEVLVHFGKKGMKWGVRNKSSSGPTGSNRGKVKRTGTAAKGVAKALGRGADNALFEIGAQNQRVKNNITLTASAKLANDLPGIKAKHGAYGKMRNRVKRPFSKEAKAYRADVKTAYLKRLEEAANKQTNIRGTRNYTLKENGKPNTKQYYWEISTQKVKHADEAPLIVRPIFDDEGWIVDIEVVDKEMAQTMEKGLNFLIMSDIIYE